MKHYNPTIPENATRIFNLKNGDMLPEDIDVIANIPITNVVNIIKRASAVNATSGQVYITPTDKDFYITAAQLSVTKDVTSTSTDSTISIFQNGVGGLNILDIGGITLTAQSESTSLSYDPPIKVDRGTAITVTNSTNVANIKSTAVIIGYTVETTKGV